MPNFTDLASTPDHHPQSSRRRVSRIQDQSRCPIDLWPVRMLSAEKPSTIAGGISAMSCSIKPQLSHTTDMPAFLQAGIWYCSSLSTIFKPGASNGRPKLGVGSNLQIDDHESSLFSVDCNSNFRCEQGYSWLYGCRCWRGRMFVIEIHWLENKARSSTLVFSIIVTGRRGRFGDNFNRT